ncbi:hypothetical protein [Micromonospora sp. NPDC005203]|uniref:hypothetical protein n=1 Tax=Micromonospora sp. NPDC005203 TaxID=3364226 RepID=UPI003694B41C
MGSNACRLDLLFGGLGLWRGVTLLRRAGGARDSTGTPVWLVLVESSGLTVLGVALLLDGWMNLTWLAVVQMSIGAVGSIHRWLRRVLPPARPARALG